MGEEVDTFDAPPAEGLRTRAVRGGAVVMSAQAAKFVLKLGATAVLARVLKPSDFGLLAMVTAVTGFLVLFKDMGLSTATIQRKEITRGQVSTLFWANVLFSALIMGAVAGLAPLISWFYEEPRLMEVTLWLSGGFLLSGLAVQHQALLKRRMQFGRLAAVEIASLAGSLGVGIGAALAGEGYWSLVWMHLAAAAVTLVGTWIASGWLPGRPARGTGVRPMMAFGGYLTGSRFLNYLVRNADKVLLGRFCGTDALGLYGKAYQLLMLPIQLINAPLSAVMVPTLSRLQDDPERYVRYYKRGVLLVTAVGMPIVAFSFAAADEIVLLVLGSQWTGAVPIFRVLAVAAWMGTTNVATGWVFASLGQGRRVFTINAVLSPVKILGYVAGLPWGAFGVAVSFSATTLLLRPLSLAYCLRCSPVRLRDFAGAIGVPAVASCAAAAAAVLVARTLPTDAHLLVRLAALAASCGGSFALVALALPQGRQQIREVGRTLGDVLARTAADPSAAARGPER